MTQMKLMVASNNSKKLIELEQVLADLGIDGVELVSMAEAGYSGEPKEDGLSFEDNALIKARAGAAATGLACVADDSGLTVAALRGMPGVLSARWSGAHGDDEANNRLLLAQMEDIELRDAAFVSCCALVAPGGGEWTAKGRWEGSLLREPRGKNGFGYDPLFAPSDAPGKSSAELTAAEKNARSHRGKALRALAPAIAALRG